MPASVSIARTIHRQTGSSSLMTEIIRQQRNTVRMVEGSAVVVLLIRKMALVLLLALLCWRDAQVY